MYVLFEGLDPFFIKIFIGTYVMVNWVMQSCMQYTYLLLRFYIPPIFTRSRYSIVIQAKTPPDNSEYLENEEFQSLERQEL
jgi:hypothetical protein